MKWIIVWAALVLPIGAQAAEGLFPACTPQSPGITQCQAGSTLRCVCFGTSCSWIPFGASCTSGGPTSPIPTQSSGTAPAPTTTSGGSAR